MDSPSIDTGTVANERGGGQSGMVVIARPSKTAWEWNVPGRGTLAEDNPQYPADDGVVIVLHRGALDEHYPWYSGVKPLSLTDLNERGVKFYAFPESRLVPVGEIEPHEVELANIRPSPYHSRSFCAEDNREFIDETRERGDVIYPLLLRPRGESFEILNGHKRAWVAHLAGLETVSARCLYISDARAARTFVNAHLDKYDEPEHEKATGEIRSAFDPETARQVLS